ncbi:MAG: acyl-CoA carboxylase subunit beta [Proteobacteria bacterium]|nr:acyl-CoA carboxylase subunit beta [Pseudomonadota bacterium]
MPAFESRLKTDSESFERNRAQMWALVQEVRSLEQAVREHSGRKAERFAARGQLLPRERVARLLDGDRDFLELSSLAGFRMHDDDGREGITGGGAVVGVGFVCGRRAVIYATDSAIKGGAVTPMGLRKHLRAQQIALVEKLPMFSLVESGGANLMYQAEIFVDGGRVFANMARMSAAGIPQITVVHGSSTAGGAYVPGLSDYVVAVQGKARIFLAGPPLVKAALGQEASDEQLGGAEMHARKSGTVEYVAQDDAEAIALARELAGKALARPLPVDRPACEAPRYDPEELLGVSPFDPRVRYDCREILARVVDASDLLEFKGRYGPQTVCGHASIEGHPCGFVGNNGPIDVAGAAKAAHFIQACCQAGIPIIYLQNTTGFMVGVDAEEKGIVKHGAKMLQAVANASVAQITLLVGASYGAGNYAMCGRALDPRFLFAWPNARVAVMGGEQAATVMDLVTRAKLERAGKSLDEEQAAQMREALKTKIDRESSALFGAARLWDDGIIDPRDTRKVLAFALATCAESRRRELGASSFGVARP